MEAPLVDVEDLEALAAADLEELLVEAVDVLEVDFLLEDFLDVDWFGSFGICAVLVALTFL